MSPALLIGLAVVVVAVVAVGGYFIFSGGGEEAPFVPPPVVQRDSTPGPEAKVEGEYQEEGGSEGDKGLAMLEEETPQEEENQGDTEVRERRHRTRTDREAGNSNEDWDEERGDREQPRSVQTGGKLEP
jgi:hypothetical protein